MLNAKSIIILDTISGDPISSVNIFSNDKGTTTNESGMCDIKMFGKSDKITFSMIGYKTISIPMIDIGAKVYLERESIPMELVNVIGKGKKYKKRYMRLERNVRKVYPYARKVSFLLNEYSAIIDSLEQYSGFTYYFKKREIFSKIEDELFSEYGYSVKKLTKTQGRILIKLIDRETGRSSFNIIKDFRNVFNAGFWQFTARLFGQNLRAKYDRNSGEDRIIEIILNRIKYQGKDQIQ